MSNIFDRYDYCQAAQNSTEVLVTTVIILLSCLDFEKVYFEIYR